MPLFDFYDKLQKKYIYSLRWALRWVTINFIEVCVFGLLDEVDTTQIVLNKKNIFNFSEEAKDNFKREDAIEFIYLF